MLVQEIWGNMILIIIFTFFILLDMFFMSIFFTCVFSVPVYYNVCYGFSSSHVRMWELDHKEGWTLKNWCFWAVLLEKTLESPLDWKEIKPVSPKGINPEYSLEGLMLKLQYFGHLMRRADSLQKTLMLGKIEGGRRRGQQRMTLLDIINNSWTWIWAKSGRLCMAGKSGTLKSSQSQWVGHYLVTEQHLLKVKSYRIY